MACPEEIKELWEIVKDSFRSKMPSAAFDVWYGSISPSHYDAAVNELVFDTNSEFKYKTLTEKYKPLIEEAFAAEAGMELTVTFRFVGTPVDTDSLKSMVVNGHTPTSVSAPSPLSITPSLQEKYTFENFIVGNSNHFAHAVCRQVANNPSDVYNPLFIHGPSGVGKTHLMYAVINEMRRRNPDTRVIYTKGDDFINYMVECLAHKNMAVFRDRYRNCDVLLIDDIQFIAGRQSTQEEVFHTFQALFDEGKQIILASDRPPKDINPLEERLRSRFEQGMMADIGLPNLELRLAIIKKKTETLNLFIPDEVMMFLAENLRSNIRQIEGAIKKLAAKSMIDGRNISMELARDSIADLLGNAESLDTTIDKIFSAIFKKYNVKKEQLLGKSRVHEVSHARHVAIYLIRKITELSYPNIGKIFGSHHTSMMNSEKWVMSKITKDVLFASDIELLEGEITGN